MSSLPLPDALHRRITSITDRGNDLAESGDTAGALAEFQNALRLVPEPKRSWEAATWLYASMGDCQFLLDRFEDAKDSLVEAQNCPDGSSNPFIAFRLGQTLYELGDLAGAKNALTQAYMLEGNEIFDEEDPKYLAFLGGSTQKSS